MTTTQELESKLNRVRMFMDQQKHAAVYCKAQHNFSWFTCGGSDQIIHGYPEGFPGILVTFDDVFVVVAELLSRGVFPLVLLVGTDHRIFRFRHPKPTEKKLERYCVIVVCAERWGLILSMTRLFHFGKPPAEIAAKYDALLQVDLAYIRATREGNTLSQVFEAGRRMYREVGFSGEERMHYQGGTCGYLIREQDLEKDNRYVIQQGEIFAHNPTITGVSVEDSILLEKEGYRVLTLSESWPAREVEYGGTSVLRPEILSL